MQASCWIVAHAHKITACFFAVLQICHVCCGPHRLSSCSQRYRPALEARKSYEPGQSCSCSCKLN